MAVETQLLQPPFRGANRKAMFTEGDWGAGELLAKRWA